MSLGLALRMRLRWTYAAPPRACLPSRRSAASGLSTPARHRPGMATPAHPASRTFRCQTPPSASPPRPWLPSYHSPLLGWPLITQAPDNHPTCTHTTALVQHRCMLFEYSLGGKGSHKGSHTIHWVEICRQSVHAPVQRSRVGKGQPDRQVARRSVCLDGRGVAVTMRGPAARRCGRVEEPIETVGSGTIVSGGQ